MQTNVNLKVNGNNNINFARNTNKKNKKVLNNTLSGLSATAATVLLLFPSVKQCQQDVALNTQKQENTCVMSTQNSDGDTFFLSLEDNAIVEQKYQTVKKEYLDFIKNEYTWRNFKENPLQLLDRYMTITQKYNNTKEAYKISLGYGACERFDD